MIDRSLAWMFGCALAILIHAPAAEAQSGGSAGVYNVLSHAQGTRPLRRDMLDRYLRGEAEKLFQKRKAEVAALKTAEEIQARQHRLKDFFLASLGAMPERTPLNPTVAGSIEREGFRIERVIFESRPHHHITANLYVPAGAGPFPGVLVPCGHSANGKAEPTYQAICSLLARAGCVALCYDPIGQGERLQALDAAGKPLVENTNEHTMADIAAILIGRQTASYRIWDGMRALDYLASRPEVDPARMGCTGNSGGGTMTAYLSTLDDRILAAAPSCYITSLERLFATIGPQDGEQNIVGQVAAGLDHADYLTIRAPKPTLATVGTRDFFDIDGSWQSFREAKLLYGKLGFGERVDLFESDEPHGFTRPRRLATARFMRRWLLKQDDDFAASEPAPLGDSALQCTQKGQVGLAYTNEVSVFGLIHETANALCEARAKHPLKPDALRVAARRRLGLADRGTPRIKPHLIADRRVRGLTIALWRYEVEPGILLPAVTIARSEGTPTATRVIVGGDKEKAIPALTPESIGTKRVIFLDPRGMGETAPEPDRGAGALFGDDWKLAFLALHLNRPLLGQRVLDVLAVLSSIAAESPASKPTITLVGQGAGGPIVLHAALLDGGKAVAGVEIENSLVSWTNVAEHGLSRGQIGNVAPGVLFDYDLPELAQSLAPLPLVIRSPRDAMGSALEKNAFQAYSTGLRLAYAGKGALTIDP